MLYACEGARRKMGLADDHEELNATIGGCRGRTRYGRKRAMTRITLALIAALTATTAAAQPPVPIEDVQLSWLKPQPKQSETGLWAGARSPTVDEFNYWHNAGIVALKATLKPAPKPQRHLAGARSRCAHGSAGTSQ